MGATKLAQPRRDDARELTEALSTERPAFDGKPVALRIGQAEIPGTELLVQNFVLGTQVLDRRNLSTLEPSRDREHEEVKRGRSHDVPFLPRRAR